MTTDIIVGFPGETEKDFEATCELFEYCAYESAYLFKYSPRPGTPAFELNDDVSRQEKKRRFLELETIQRRSTQRSFKNKIGTTLSVLCEKVSGKDSSQISGHSTCHAVVNFEGDDSLLGKIVEIRITEAKSNTLFGEMV